MDPVIWTEKLSVGVARLDEQHKRLIQMINRLIREPDVTTRSQIVSDLLTDMTDYAGVHFAAEEELLAEHGYPHCQEQIQEHRAFRKKTVDFCSAATLDVPVIPLAMLAYLREWLVHHILEVDMKYRLFFQERGVE